MTSLVLSPEPRDRRDQRIRELLFDIKDAALEQLSDAGVPGLSYRTIAAKLGVSRSTLRYHFPTRNSLIGALVDDGFTTLERSLRAALARVGGTPAERWSALAHAYRDWALRHPRHYLMLYTGTATGPDTSDGMTRVIRVFAEFLAEHGDPEPSVAALSVHARLHGVVSQELNSPASLEGVDHERLFSREVLDLAHHVGGAAATVGDGAG
jgi:AcrR family transcriptional regulator